MLSPEQFGFTKKDLYLFRLKNRPECRAVVTFWRDKGHDGFLNRSYRKYLSKKYHAFLFEMIVSVDPWETPWVMRAPVLSVTQVFNHFQAN